LTFQYLNVDVRDPDYFLTDVEVKEVRSAEVDLSDEFIQRYKEAVDNYDGIQAELELIFSGKEVV
jgi:hypothetical protein